MPDVNDTLANVPAVVAVAFVRSISGEVSPYERLVFNVYLADLALDEYAGMIGHVGTVVIKSAAIGDITTSYEAITINTDQPPPDVVNWTDLGVVTDGADDWNAQTTYAINDVVQIPDNFTELNALANQIATDYYRWKLASLELRLSSYVLLDGDGGHDLEFWHDDPMTVIHRSGWEPDTGEFVHSGTNGSIDPDQPSLIGLGKEGVDINLSTTPVAWEAGIVYRVGWIVEHTSLIYRCIVENFSVGGINEPPSAEWIDITGQDLTIINIPDTVQSVNGNTTPRQTVGINRTGSVFNITATPVEWSSGRVYQEGDLVIWSLVVYRCVLENYNVEPPSLGTWVVVTENLPGWSGTQQYEIGWVVEYLSNYYYCIAPSLNNAPPNTNYWAKITSNGINVINIPASVSGITSINDDTTASQTVGLGVAGSDINISETPSAWSSSQTYLPGWLVTSGGNTYRCILASNNNVPPNATYWVLTTGDGISTINIPRLQIATPSGTATGNPNFSVTSSNSSITFTGSGNTVNAIVNTTTGPCKCLPAGSGFGILVWDAIVGEWILFPACKDGYVLVFDSMEPYGVKCVPNCCPDIPKYWYCLDEPAEYQTKACCPKPIPDTLTMTVVVGAVTDTATLTYDGGSGTWIGTGMFGTCDMADWNLSCDGTDWILDVNGTTYTSLQSVCEPFSAIFSGVDLTACGETTGGVVSIVQ